jgi:hypothetical protein
LLVHSVLLGLRSQLREDNSLSRAEAVFGTLFGIFPKLWMLLIFLSLVNKFSSHLPTPTASLIEGGSQIKNIDKKGQCPGNMGEMLLQFSHENAGLEALHFQGETKQLKIHCHLLFPNCPSKAVFR